MCEVGCFCTSSCTPTIAAVTGVQVNCSGHNVYATATGSNGIMPPVPKKREDSVSHSWSLCSNPSGKCTPVTDFSQAFMMTALPALYGTSLSGTPERKTASVASGSVSTFRSFRSIRNHQCGFGTKRSPGCLLPTNTTSCMRDLSVGSQRTMVAIFVSGPSAKIVILPWAAAFLNAATIGDVHSFEPL